MIPDAKIKFRIKPELGPKGSQCSVSRNHHKSQGREIKDRRGFLPERLGEELRRGLKCSHEKHREPNPPGKGKPQPNAQNRYETMSNHQRVSAQASFGENQMGKRWNNGQGQDKSGGHRECFGKRDRLE